MALISDTSNHLTPAQEDFFQTHALWQPLISPPVRLTRPFAWVGHLPFGRAIAKLAAPRVLVELGTHTGNSFCAFCQAVEEYTITTRCYAVDTWEGDVHAGFYGDVIYEDLQKFIGERFSEMASLLRTTFDEAQPNFEDGSIDLLHIDGLHTYEEVKHDFEYWKPKLSNRSVVLFHDTQVFDRGFGVHQLWKELSEEYPSFEFTHSHGLGVLVTGSENVLLNEFIRIAQERPAAIQNLFERISLAGLPAEVVRYQQRFASSIETDYEILDCELYLEQAGNFSESLKLIQSVKLNEGKGVITFDLRKFPFNAQRVRFDPGHRALALHTPFANAIDLNNEAREVFPVKTSAWVQSGEDLIFEDDPWLEFDLTGIEIKILEIHLDILSLKDTLRTLVQQHEATIKIEQEKIKDTEKDLTYYRLELQKHEEMAKKLWKDLQEKDNVIQELKETITNLKN
jgi:hypothetical protein